MTDDQDKSEQGSALPVLHEYAGCKAMSAPNRYRKMIPGSAEYGGSPALMWFFSAGFSDAPRDAVAQKMREEWPEMAHLVVGMEPTIDLCDVILIWRAA